MVEQRARSGLEDTFPTKMNWTFCIVLFFLSLLIPPSSQFHLPQPRAQVALIQRSWTIGSSSSPPSRLHRTCLHTVKSPAKFDKATINTLIQESEEPLILLDFTTKWCGPCKKMGTVVDEVEKILDGKVRVAKIDALMNEEVASLYDVGMLPTFIVLNKNGEELERISGVFEPKKMVEFVESCF